MIPELAEVIADTLSARDKRISALEAELERERIRLAACGVVALSNTPESAKQAREMHPDYESASCSDVARMVDKNMELEAQLAASQQREAELREAWENYNKIDAAYTYSIEEGGYCEYTKQDHREAWAKLDKALSGGG
jgi:hypothetical protein